MKTYIAIIDICKTYVHGYTCDSYVWQKEFTNKRDAQIFIYRVGKGKKGLYDVTSTYIEVEVNNELIG